MKHQKQANCLQNKSYEGLLSTYECYYRSPKGQSSKFNILNFLPISVKLI